ncbi:hypothetical protein [Mycobacterium aquaticum]|uniref:Uncharacterized protein n=1 Tax=Mycobacterium aquaticum TaxID=1927124 RepID=A0A1W9ZW23_9MYCO|nr:hypothetical protein [Mycobacterium aquaticum]ORA21982.1 hypothetical protein BST13_36845 [Mycobacterium aquaticum]
MAAEKKISVRALAAVVGGGAVLALGWLGVASGGSGTSLAVHLPPPPPTVTSPAMQIGATTTTLAPATQPLVAKAKPNIKGPAALPSEEAGLP